MDRKTFLACACLPVAAVLAVASPVAAQNYHEIQALSAQLREAGGLRALDDAALERAHGLFAETAAAMVADDGDTALERFAAVVGLADARPAGTPPYFDDFGTGGAAFYAAILDETRAARERDDWKAAEAWSLVEAAASLGTSVRADGAADTVYDDDFARIVATIAYSIAMQNGEERLSVFIDGIFAIAPDMIDRSIALELAERVSSLAAFGDGDRDRAGPFAERLAASFASAGIAIDTHASGILGDVLGRIALDTGNYDDAEAQYAADGLPDRDTEIALTFRRGNFEAGIAALLGLEVPPEPAQLTLAQAATLAEYADAGPEGQLALYALALPLYERTLPVDDMRR